MARQPTREHLNYSRRLNNGCQTFGGLAAAECVTTLVGAPRGRREARCRGLALAHITVVCAGKVAGTVSRAQSRQEGVAENRVSAGMGS